MIDLEKEREAFEDAYQHHSFIKDVYRAGNSYSVMPHLNIAKDKKKIIVDLANSSWNAWQRCSLRAQDEITELKQQLSEAHKSRASWVEYSQKIENGEFVLVPREPTHEMLRAAYKHVMDCHATPESAYKVMIEAVEKDHE